MRAALGRGFPNVRAACVEPLGTLDIGLAGSLDTSHNVHPSVTPVDVTELSKLGCTNVQSLAHWVVESLLSRLSSRAHQDWPVLGQPVINGWKEPGGQNLNI